MTLQKAEKCVTKAVSACGINHKPLIAETFAKLDTPFDGLDTEKLQKAYIKNNFCYLPYQEIELGKTLMRKKVGGKRRLFEKSECFIYIPIIESLKQLLGNKRLKALILKPHKTRSKGIYHDVCDGSIFQDDEYFSQNPHAIGLILYHDELELCNPLSSKAGNPLSSKAGNHKLDMYYYTLTNIPPKYRSKRSAVRLIAIVNAKYVKKYKINKVMSPLLRDLKELYNGVTFDCEDKQLQVYGKVVLCVGDTLGQHLWGGFKEGVGGSFQKCRTCYCLFEPMQEHFCESSFVLRTKEQHGIECTQIENVTSKSAQKDLKRIYGLNQRSPLCELPDFDVTCQLPQDVMHTMLEGVVQYELRLVILNYLNNNIFTLANLNDVI